MRYIDRINIIFFSSRRRSLTLTMASLSLVIVIDAIAMSHWPVPDARSVITAPVVLVKHCRHERKERNKS